MSLTEQITALATRVGQELKSVRAAKADDTAVVHLTGNETVSGVKTFGSAPVVPIGALAGNPVRRDDARLTDARAPTAHVHTAPVAQLRQTASVTCSNANTWYTIPFAAEDFDDDGGHSTTSQTSRFTAQRAGRYRVSAVVLWNSGQSTAGGTIQRGCRLIKNGVYVNGSQSLVTYAGLWLTQAIPPMYVNLAAGEYVELQCYGGLAGSVAFANSFDGAILVVDFDQ